MSHPSEPNVPVADAGQHPDGRKHSPPAFLDLADSRVELKRMEHERQRALQRKMFENQMRALEQQQAKELLSIPFDGGVQHVAVSAPTTPPRQSAGLPPGVPSALANQVDVDLLSRAVDSAASEKRKSVTYAPAAHSPEMLHAAAPGYGRMGGHKSMPASRRTSASSQDEELAGHLNNLSLIGARNDGRAQAPGTPTLAINGQYRDSEGGPFGNAFNAGVLLDEQLDQEMHNAMRNLPTPADDKFSFSKTSNAALDLAPLSSTSPRPTYLPRGLEQPREKASEWPQFEGGGLRGPDGLTARGGRRTATNPNLGGLGDKLNGTMSASATPLLQQGLGSRRGSPLSIPEHHLASMAAAARSVPGTPLGSGVSGSVASHLMKSGAATPLLTDPTTLNGRLSSHMNESPVSANDLQASLARLGGGGYDSSPVSFNSIRSGLDDSIQQQFEVDPGYALGGGLDNGRFNGGSAALYGTNGGARYGLGVGRINSADGKMNGLHGPKHKRGEADREFNRFAGTRLEDLVGEIASLCKDQHGCRYFQKKLEEGLPEHRDIIFKETYGHFAELMTDPFGNYLCQKLLEYATDDQRNMICASVAQDLVNISLNMHGTRAVQKMIDFLSTRRQRTDPQYQIHSIIVALSLHVVVLIKDLNGNHVVQKCLNKLAPEDNQFIYNAVAANCVEVATHRHGCCVLQRCIDHASDQQRVQLVNEITYNALTLVQDPYGNYVVQYILDLNDNRFSDGVIRQFTGNVCALSVQKFSSNVIEKCIRVAEHSTRKILVEELLNRTRLEKLLRDSYGNYCVQTALDYADPQQRALLVEGIRPVLPLIRNTPYGKRIQNKLQREQMDHYGGGGGGGYSHIHHNQPVGGMGYGGQGLGSANGLGGGRHLHQGGGLNDVYGSPAGGVYSLGGSSALGGGHLPQPMHSGLHSHHSSIDPYVLQGAGQGLHAQGEYGSFGGAGGFAGNGLSGGAIHQPAYQQRSNFGYGM